MKRILPDHTVEDLPGIGLELDHKAARQGGVLASHRLLSRMFGSPITVSALGDPFHEWLVDTPDGVACVCRFDEGDAPNAPVLWQIRGIVPHAGGWVRGAVQKAARGGVADALAQYDTATNRDEQAAAAVLLADTTREMLETY